MAAGNSSRGARRRGRSGGNRPRTHPLRSTDEGPPESAGADSGVLACEIHLLAVRLDAICRIAVTVEMTLRCQNADQDGYIADCLRHAVCGPIWDQSKKAHGLSKRLGRVREQDFSRGHAET